MKKVLTRSTQSLIILAASFLATASVSAAPITQADSTGTVAFTESQTDIPDVINPEVPEEDGPNGTPGTFAIDYASNFDFGSHAHSPKQQTYYAKADTTAFTKPVAPFIEIHDLRGLGVGNNTQLTVKQLEQFKNGQHKLTGAALTFSMGRGLNAAGGTYTPSSVPSFTLIPGQAQKVMQTNGTVGQFLTSYGQAADYKGTTVGGPISLSVPSGSANKGNYTATLQWDLATAP